MSDISYSHSKVDSSPVVQWDFISWRSMSVMTSSFHDTVGRGRQNDVASAGVTHLAIDG